MGIGTRTRPGELPTIPAPSDSYMELSIGALKIAGKTLLRIQGGENDAVTGWILETANSHAQTYALLALAAK